MFFPCGVVGFAPCGGVFFGEECFELVLGDAGVFGEGVEYVGGVDFFGVVFVGVVGGGGGISPVPFGGGGGFRGFGFHGNCSFKAPGSP